MRDYKVKLNFIRDILGSQPADDELKTKYIKAKMMTGRTGMSAEIAQERVKKEMSNLEKDEDYQATIDSIEDKGITVFYRNEDGKPSLCDVQLRGFFKDAFAFIAKEKKILTKKDGSNYSGDAKYRDWIGARIRFVQQYYPFPLKEIDLYQRPLRAQTPTGPRVCIAGSERMKAPLSLDVSFVITDDVKDEWVVAVLDRGIFKGLGQFANSQWGSFTYEIV